MIFSPSAGPATAQQSLQADQALVARRWEVLADAEVATPHKSGQRDVYGFDFFAFSATALPQQGCQSFTRRLPGLTGLHHCLRKQICVLLAGGRLLPMHFSDVSDAINDLVDRELAKSAAA